jgi:hypothetical protein
VWTISDGRANPTQATPSHPSVMTWPSVGTATADHQVPTVLIASTPSGADANRIVLSAGEAIRTQFGLRPFYVTVVPAGSESVVDEVVRAVAQATDFARSSNCPPSGSLTCGNSSSSAPLPSLYGVFFRR